MSSRYIVHNHLVVHEGFANTPKIKEKLHKLIDRLITIRDREDSHLADQACGIVFVSNDLKSLSDEIFRLHDLEKKSPYNSIHTNP